ncbi:hypothetical protein EC991_009580 [Linnemannia zychae]|nr:hypothetical protein EC991_009580 [Linnemannia zychae]
MIVKNPPGRTEQDIHNDVNVTEKAYSNLRHMLFVVRYRHAYCLECSDEDDVIDTDSFQLKCSLLKQQLDAVVYLLRELRQELLNAATSPVSLDVVNKLSWVIPRAESYIEEALSYWD